MRLTTFTDYGVRAMMRLAGSPQRLFTIEEISLELGVSRNHLTKIIQNLAKGGYIQTLRGKGGGFRLAKDPAQITLGEIVRWLEPETAIVECFRKDGGSCTLTAQCRFKNRLHAAGQAFLEELDQATLKECAIPDWAFLPETGKK